VRRPGLREAMQAGWAMFWLVCGVLVLGWSLGAIFVALGPTMLSGILPGGSLALAGLVVTSFQLAAGTTQFACRRMASTRAVPLGLALMSLAWLGCVLGLHFQRPLPFTLCALAAGVGYGASFVGAMNRFTTLTPADHRATLGSLFYLAGYVGSGLAILAVGALVDAIELLPAMGVVAVCLVAGSLALVLARRRVQPPPPVA
jgi:MFS family permease